MEGNHSAPRHAPHTASAPTRSAQKKTSPVISDILTVLLMTGVILVVFSFFHHVLPRLTASTEEIVPISTAAPKESASQAEVITVVTPSPSPESSPQEEVTDEPVPSAEPDTRTPWQIKFEEHFTDEVIKTDSSYSSPNISVTIETRAGTYGDYYQTIYIADIYVASIDCLKTYFSYDKFTYYGEEDPTTISANSGAILSINGDYCNNQQSGLLVRNGNVYYDDAPDCDICVLYYDGTVETLSPGAYSPEEVLAAGPYQSWKFGPMLLDSSGKALTSFNTTSVIESEAAPRTGFGYYEPGHYCFVVVDGRQSHSRGMVLSELAQLFEELGCTCAYNMDGGASSVMYFDSSIYNIPSAYRKLGDILLLAEPEDTAAEVPAE